MRGSKESGALGEASNRSHLEKQRGESAGAGRRVRWRAGGETVLPGRRLGVSSPGLSLAAGEGGSGAREL